MQFGCISSKLAHFHNYLGQFFCCQPLVGTYCLFFPMYIFKFHKKEHNNIVLYICSSHYLGHSRDVINQALIGMPCLMQSYSLSFTRISLLGPDYHCLRKRKNGILSNCEKKRLENHMCTLNQEYNIFSLHSKIQ